MPQWRSVYETNERIQYIKLTKEYNINGVQPISFPEYACSRVRLCHNLTREQAYSGNEIGSSTFIGLCLQYLSVFPVCADWLILIDL